uniref:Uncharacterized protein LOC105643091 isoform X1 n=1 Tax=Rhizophora mucronata TaxID=61149 RepID=A0A2P2M590_RHIMU
MHNWLKMIPPIIFFQVARVLHLIFRLVVQPNTTRAYTFAEAFITCGGVETLLVLLQREAKTGDHNILEMMNKNDSILSVQETEQGGGTEVLQRSQNLEENNSTSYEKDPVHEPSGSGATLVAFSASTRIERMSSVSEYPFIKNLGGISLSISADNARNNVYNVDRSDAIVVAMIGLIGALITSGHLKFGSSSHTDITSSLLSGGLQEGVSTMFDDKVLLLLFALQKAFQAAPNRLMTANVYTALLAASINASSTDEGLNFYDSGHRFEHSQLLLVLLRSLPYASRALQSRALQDLLFLACSHSENRSSLTNMEEWPEWILEVLISNYEVPLSGLTLNYNFIDFVISNICCT